MTAPSKPTVSDRVVKQGIERLIGRVAVEYEKCCMHQPASQTWFEHLDRVHVKLAKMFAKRPISKAEVTATCDKAFKALRVTLQSEKAKQPKYREAIDFMTGKSRWIHDYGE